MGSSLCLSPSTSPLAFPSFPFLIPNSPKFFLSKPNSRSSSGPSLSCQGGSLSYYLLLTPEPIALEPVPLSASSSKGLIYFTKQNASYQASGLGSSLVHCCKLMRSLEWSMTPFHVLSFAAAGRGWRHHSTRTPWKSIRLDTHTACAFTSLHTQM